MVGARRDLAWRGVAAVVVVGKNYHQFDLGTSCYHYHHAISKMRKRNRRVCPWGSHRVSESVC